MNPDLIERADGYSFDPQDQEAAAMAASWMLDGDLLFESLQLDPLLNAPMTEEVR